MIKLSDLMYYKKQLLSDEQCANIVNEYESNSQEPAREHCLHAFTGVDTWSTFDVKEPRIGSDVFRLIHSSIETMVNEYQDHLDTFDAFHVIRRRLMCYPHTYRLMKYRTGAWIHPHIDKDSGVYGSCTINLNDDYSGGLFAFWGGKHKIRMEKGDAMIWPADHFWVHEVEEITSGVRYSVNCFLRDSPRYLPESVKYDVRQSGSRSQPGEQ